VPAEATLRLRFLGDVEVVRSGERLALPQSKKTRALLAYLALTGRPHRRERLCGLFWDVADDPRGALRWSLSRLRAVVDEPGRTRILAPRDSVAFAPEGAWIDVLALRRRCAAGLDDAPVAELISLAQEFRGELLEDLDLGDFLDFQAWCVAEREETRKLHASLLRVLVRRLAGDPESALPHARVLASVDPLDEAARASVVRLLAAAGRRREAEQQYETAKRLLMELGSEGSGELEEAWRGARPAARPSAPTPEDEPVAGRPFPGAHPLVGRHAERERFVGALDVAVRDGRERVLLVTGEPGLGKSRLIDELCSAARARGATVLEGRAFEAEAGRPFGPWVDALRQLPPAVVGTALGGDLGALLPELNRGGAPQSRDRLFAAVVQLLSAGGRGTPAVVVALDDVHWLDAASAELLHYVARTCREQPLLVALTARAGELPDNETARRVLRGLRQMGLVEEIPLAPLGGEETRQLVLALSPAADAERAFEESGGNPLLALEVARSLPRVGSTLPASLTELVRGRVERLAPEAGDVLRWAAVLGCGFEVDRLRGLMALDLDRLLGALELLERHALLRASGAGGEAKGSYTFTHEVVRRAVYSELSEPRRRLMHLRVAQRLGREDGGEEAAAELARHAALAGESALAARSCAAAGRRFQRLFANEEARAIARRGRRHAEEVAEPERTRLLLELLHVELQARRPADVDAAAAELEGLAERALEQGAAEHARLGFHMLAYLRWEEGAFSDAERHMMRAELVSRAGDEREQVVAMAEAARCLVLLERDLPRAEALALEASARSGRAGIRPPAIADAQGMLRAHQGRLAEAAELFEEARLGAKRESDRMGEFQALEHLVVLRQQQGCWEEARRLCLDLDRLGARLREGSEAPFARALVALTSHALGEPEAQPALDAALEELRVADAKHRLAYTLTRAAHVDLDRGDSSRARARAEEARRMAQALGRPTETLLAGVVLARACRGAGDADTAELVRSELQDAPPPGASAFARHQWEALLQRTPDGVRATPEEHRR
jgi:DNA-binding SARP family transcriptional activator